jgi:hypothetical protein
VGVTPAIGRLHTFDRVPGRGILGAAGRLGDLPFQDRGLRQQRRFSKKVERPEGIVVTLRGLGIGADRG